MKVWLVLAMVGCSGSSTPAKDAAILGVRPRVPDASVTSPAVAAADAAGPAVELVVAKHQWLVAERGACMRAPDDELTCWGWEHPASAGSGVPKHVGKRIRLIAHAGSGTCEATDLGDVTCWGAGSNVTLSGLGDVVEISGHTPTCARRRDGTVACWSSDSSASDDDRRRPRELSLTLVAEMAIGWEEGCFRLASGDVTCWSARGSSEVRVPVDRLGPVEVAKGALSIALWQDQGATLVAVLPGGKLVGWSLEAKRAVALPAPSFTAERVVANGTMLCVVGGRVGCLDRGAFREIPQLIDAVDVAPGSMTSCALRRDGTTACWGVRGYLGDSETPSTQDPSLVPNLGDAVELDGKGSFCARKATGEVICWGTPERPTAGTVDSYAREVPGLVDAQELVVQSNYSCARVMSGDVKCWGYLSGKDPNLYLAPRAIKALKGARDLFRVYGDVCGLRSGKTVCDGRKPTELRGWSSTVRQLWEGERARHSFYCLRDAKGVSCTREYHGRDYDEKSEESFSVDMSKARAILFLQDDLKRWIADEDGAVFSDDFGTVEYVPGVTDVIALAAAVPYGMPLDADVCGLRTSGEVMCWRENRVRTVPGITDGVEIASAGSAICVRRRTGAVVCWGDRDYLGNGDSSRRDTPGPVLLP